jgi:putative colanic acid biosynthesis UDP-glucose lipid carrier transferase
VCYIAVKRGHDGPVIFKQERIGRFGRPFYIYKFRSMIVDAEKEGAELLQQENDPRLTNTGKFLRDHHLDELPQFWNVLCGDMSIVGPRPHMLAHTEQYSQLIDKYMVRHFVRPGITGWAQVTGYRGETQELWQMEGRIKRDIWYIENWSFWLDLRIIWRTLRQLIIPDKNAY